MNYNILGGGPAGLSSAIVLAKSGFNVNLFEQTNTIGGFIGLDVQAIRNYGLFDSNVLEKLNFHGLKIKDYNEVYRIEKYSPELKFDTIYSDKSPLFYTIKRGVSDDSLENQLYKLALDLGVNINLGHKKKHSEVDIVASGSKFHPEGAIYGALFDLPDFDKHLIQFFFIHYKGHSGYLYAAPYKDGKVTLALTSFDKTNFSSLKAEFYSILKNHKIVSKIFKPENIIHSYGGFGHYNIPHSAIHEGKLIVGGAAGFVDPARGFGIKYAMMSGALAARSIITNENYDDLWKKEFEKELFEGFSRKLIFENLSENHVNNLVSGAKISIEDYEKTPSAIRDLLYGINGSLHLENWRSKFSFHEIYPL